MTQAQAESSMRMQLELRGWEALAVTGADARMFLHAQFASDVARLTPGRWQFGCWLNAQGRTIALFVLVAESQDRLLLLLPCRRADSIAERLRRFVLRAKATIEVAGELAIIGEYAASECRGMQIAAGGELAHGGGSIRIELGGSASRTLVLEAGKREAHPDADDSIWRRADVDDGLPWLAAEVAETWTPQALALERIDAYSVSKGCYPGQEVVARTHFLGRNKRRLARVAGTSATLPTCGARLQASSEPGSEAAGELVLVAPGPAPGEFQALAVLRDSAPQALALGNGLPIQLRGVLQSPAK